MSSKILFSKQLDVSIPFYYYLILAILESLLQNFTWHKLIGYVCVGLFLGYWFCSIC